MKWMGVCLLILSFAAIGLLLGANYRRRIGELEQWLRTVKHLERAICYEERVLAESLECCAQYSAAPIANLFFDCNEKMARATHCFEEAWQSSWEVYLQYSNLTATDRQIIQDFASRLGKGDMEDQEKAFAFFYQQMHERLAQAKEEVAAREKICRCFIWSGGLALVLIFY